jgi:signal transduction histidine kinase
LDQLEENFRTDKAESLSQLISYVAHEIKNPLHSLQLHIKILENEIAQTRDISQEKKERIQKTLSVLLDETKRLDGLAHQFLKLGQLKDRIPVSTDINELLESILEVIRPELNERGIELLTAFDKRLPKFLIQREKMVQAFLNLAKNAMEALPKRGGKLAIRTAKTESGCQIEFRDNGEGIAPKHLERIFEPYFSTKKEGSGLGLLFVKDTVENHGGRIRVESRKGRGTVFTLYLPLKKEQLKLPRGSK